MVQLEKQKEPPKSEKKTIFCSKCGVEIVINHVMENISLELLDCRLCGAPISLMHGRPCTICFKGV